MSLKKLFVTAVFCFVTAQAFTQLQYAYFYYLDSENEPTENPKAVYIVKVYKDKPGDALWTREYMTKVDRKLLSFGYCSDSLGKIFEGEYKIYDIKGNLERQGSYKNDKKTGDWTGYFASGKIFSIYHFDNGKMTGLCRAWYEDGKLQDSFNLDKSGNGNGIGFYSTGQKKYEGKFSGGNKTGEWKYYYDLPGDKKSMTGTFEKDSLLQSTGYTTEGKVQKECFYEREAAFDGGQEKWVAYLVKGITKSKYTKYMKTTRYTTIVKFIVDKDGNVIDAKVEVAKDEDLDAIAERIIQNSPRWKPAMQYNQPVNAYRRQPITFATE
ncbi:energy transducer TonB [Ferruginibacter sp.]